MASAEEVSELRSWLSGWPEEARRLGRCAVCGIRTVGKRYCSHQCNRRMWMFLRDLEYAVGARSRPPRGDWPRDADGEAMSSKHHPGAARYIAPPRWLRGAPDNPCVVLGSGAFLRRHGASTRAPDKQMVVGVRTGVLSVPSYRLVVPHESVRGDILRSVGWKAEWRMPRDVLAAFLEFSSRGR